MIEEEDGFPKSLSLVSNKIIKEQMKNSVIKIRLNGGYGSGFLCNLLFTNIQNQWSVLITNNHVLNENDIKPNKDIEFSLNNDKSIYKIKIGKSRITYTRKKPIDITIIEIKPNDSLSTDLFLDIDNSIFQNNINEILVEKSIYLLHYPKGGKVEYSVGTIKKINNNNIEHLCASDEGSSGGPLMNLSNYKVIGIHKGGQKVKNWNLGSPIATSIHQFIKLKEANTKPNSISLSDILKKGEYFINKNGVKIYEYPEIEFTKKDICEEITLIFIGRIGEGKTNLINFFTNFLLGVKFEDKILVNIAIENDEDQKKIGTQEVNIYKISGNDKFPPFTIIDTPGLCNKEGITKDLKIIELLLQKIKLIYKINAICFVIKSYTNRLTFEEKYLFESIINLFGRNTEKNFVFMCTFSVGKKSEAIDYIIPSDPLINSVYPHWYLDFNYNLSNHICELNDNFNKKFWNLGMKSFETFIKELKKMKPISTCDTLEVLIQRNFLININIESINIKKIIESKIKLSKFGLKKEFTLFYKNDLIKSLKFLEDSKGSNEISRKNIESLNQFEKLNELIMQLFNLNKII